MTTDERRASRTLSPVQIRAIALRVQGLDITAIASQVGRDRTTVSRWFTDPLVIEELDRRVEDQYETELQQHANLRTKAMGVVEAALDGGDVKAALTILRLSPRHKDRAPVERGIPSSADPFGVAQGPIGQVDVEALLQELEVTRPWQVHVQRLDTLLGSSAPTSDEEGILDRLLLLDDVASTVVRALEEASGEGLSGYSSVDGQQQKVLLGDAKRAIDEAWSIVGGTDDDDDDEPTWPGEENADRAIRLMGEVLLALLASMEGASEALASGAGASGVRLATRLTAAHGAGRHVIEGDERRTVRSLADAVTSLTTGFTDLVAALGASAMITVDAAWAEALDGAEGGADA